MSGDLRNPPASAPATDDALGTLGAEARARLVHALARALRAEREAARRLEQKRVLR